MVRVNSIHGMKRQMGGMLRKLGILAGNWSFQVQKLKPILIWKSSDF